MKKIISIILTLILVLTTTPIFANNILGDAIYTDVVAYINHYPIPSYNFNGKTLIVAEDLTNYGFNVKWNEYAGSLTITRNKENNDISPLLTFRPLETQLWKKSLTITTTFVKVFTGNHQYSSFGGINGKTLIAISDLSSIDGVSVAWVPEINAVKVWVPDGLEMREAPFEVRRMDNNFEYYKNCSGITSWYHYKCSPHPTGLVLTIAETDAEHLGICTMCNGSLKITDVINSNGDSVLKNKNLYSYSEPTPVPYFYNYSDYYLSNFIRIDADDLYPYEAEDRGGLVKFTYRCSGGGEINETIKVDCLPYV